MADITFTHTPVSVNESAPSSSNAFPVFLTDNGGNSVTVDGNNRLEVSAFIDQFSPYAFGDVAGATDTAMPVAVIRDDALSTLTDAEGDYVGLRVNDQGALWVEMASSIAITPENVFVDNSAFTVDTDDFGLVGFLVDETAPATVTEGNVGAARMTADRKLLTRVVGATDGNRLDINASGEALVDLASISTTDILDVNLQGRGTAVNDSDKALAVAFGSGSAVNHDVTASGGDLKVEKIHVSCSAPAKFEVYSWDGVTETFITSAYITRQEGFHELCFDDLRIADTDAIRVKKENRWAAAQDLISYVQARQL